MFQDLTGQAIRTFQLKCLKIKAWPDAELAAFEDPVWGFIQANHQYNTLLWHEEDLARRVDVSDTEIANNKRNIDKYNQKRNDHIESIDEAIVARIPTIHKCKRGAWTNSETVGSIIDRMSINALRTFNMNKQIVRKDISAMLRNKLIVLKYQSDHLKSCLDTFLGAVAAGKATLKLYKQLKMYNDPKLNPYLSKSYNKDKNKCLKKTY